LTILLHGAYTVGVSRRRPYIFKRRALSTSAAAADADAVTGRLLLSARSRRYQQPF